MIAQPAGILPLKWNKTEVSVGGGPTFASADHVPALIVANPLNPLRYLVINSGPTFDAKAFQGTNARSTPASATSPCSRPQRTRTIQTCGFLDGSGRSPSLRPSTAPANEALQIIRLQAGRRHRVIGRLPPLLQNLNRCPSRSATAASTSAESADPPAPNTST